MLLVERIKIFFLKADGIKKIKVNYTIKITFRS